MNILFSIGSRATLGLVIASVLVHDASAQQNSRRRLGESRIDTTFSFDRQGTVILAAVGGDIVVTGWSRSEIRVRAESDRGGVRFDATSTRVTLDATSGPGRGSDTHLEVTVPYNVRVSARSWTGEVNVNGTRGQVEAHSQSGDVQVSDATTRVDVSTMSGEIMVEGVTGDVAVSTMSGDVTISDVRGTVDVGSVSSDIDLRGITARIVRAKTTSGDVNFDGSIDPAGRYELSTHSGDVELRVPRDAKAQLTVATWNGSIDSQFPITLQPGEHGISIAKSKRYTFDIGGGGARITAETFSGDITISTRK